MRTITIPKGAKLIKSGSFGSYYKISNKKGIKVIWRSSYSLVRKEANYLNVAAKAKLAPRCHEIVKVKDENDVHYGLIVDHVEGRASSWGGKVMEPLKRQLIKSLKEIGIKNQDLYGDNVRKTKKGYMVVDFTPSQCSFIK